MALDIPTVKHCLNDFSNVVNATDAARINSLCAQIERNTSDEIAILVLNTTQPYEIADFSIKVAEKNGIGKKGVDNGVLMVIATQDRDWRVDVGYGLEGVLNDGKIGSIGRAYMVPYLKNGQWGEGIYSALFAIGGVLSGSGETAPAAAQGGEDSSLCVVAFVIGFILMIFAVRWLSRGMPKGKGGWGGFGGMGGGWAGGGGFGGGFSGGSSGGFGGGGFGGGGAGGKF